MQNYEVKRDFPMAGRVHRKGERIPMTDKQARHLRLAGFVAVAKPEKKPAKPAPKGDAAKN